MHRAELDGTPEVTEWADTLEKIIVDTVEGGQMTKDLSRLISPETPWLTTEQFLEVLDEGVKAKMA